MDVLLISEQYKNETVNWYSDKGEKAEIVNFTGVNVDEVGPVESGFRWIIVCDINIYSCYFPPKRPIKQFEKFPETLERDVRCSRNSIVIAGDFNAKHWTWGSPHTYKRGEILMRIISSLGLSVCNNGGTATLQKDDGRRSYIDVTIVSSDISRKTLCYEVLEKVSLSDHKYILFDIGNKTERK